MKLKGSPSLGNVVLIEGVGLGARDQNSMRKLLEE
jgi:hypothetical protein